MNPEELLAMLREKGMDDAAIGNLLNDAMAALTPAPEDGAPAPVDDGAEKEQAGQLLGVGL